MPIPPKSARRLRSADPSASPSGNSPSGNSPDLPDREPPTRHPPVPGPRVRTRPSESAPRDAARDHALRLAAQLGVDVELRETGSPASAALAWASSGAMALTGERDGPPRFAAGPLASAAEGAAKLLAALAPDRGFETLDAAALLGERAALVGLGRRGAVSCGGATHLLATRDAPLALALPRDDDWRMLEAWLETALPGIASARAWDTVANAIALREAVPLVDRGRELGLALALAPDRPPRVASPFRLEWATQADPPRGPRRLKVLDLSALWAGPLAGSLLAHAGCEVLKVESPARPDGARAGTRPGESAFFDLLNADKRGAALDLLRAADRAVFARLLDAADVVLESARPRALAQLGFEARAWVEARPGRIWASLTGYGRDHEWTAFGDDAAVAAGLAFDPGPLRGRPRFCADAVADPLTGLHAAVAILALAARGRGGLLGVALADVAGFAAFGSFAPADGGPFAPPSTSHDAGALTRPLRAVQDGWVVIEAGHAHPVAAPRARAPRGRAPALAPPDLQQIARWTAPC